MATGTMLPATSGYGYVYIEQLPAIVCPLYPVTVAWPTIARLICKV